MPLVYAAIGLLSASVLIFQIALTRVFAIMLWHHFAYLVISIALLGYGAAGSWLTVRGERDRTRLALRAALFALSIPLCYWLATLVGQPGPVAPVAGANPSPVAMTHVGLGRLGLLYALVGIPFLFAGLCIGGCLARYREVVSRVYCADLVGAGLGGVLAVPILEAVGAIDTIVVAGAVAGLSAVLFAVRERTWLWPLLFVVGGAAASLWGRGRAEVPCAPGKELAHPHMAAMLDQVRWGATARIEVLQPATVVPMLGGAWGKDTPAWGQRYVFQDGSAPTALFETDGDLQKLGFLGRSTSALPYLVLPKGPEVLVIGVGGGIDVITALFHQCGRVTGAEINRAMLGVLTEFRDYTGRVFERPEVELHLAEGRSFVRHRDRQYDLIQLSGVDTFTALSSGAYALAETYLYTIEAVTDFLSHLRPGGLLAVARFTMSPPRETLRYAAIVQEALWRRGAADPARHLFITGGTMGVTLVRNEPFAAPELVRLQAFVDEQGFGTVYNPDRPGQNEFDQLLRSPDRAARDRFVDGYRFDVSPCSDDRPFFFNYFKWRNLWETKFGQERHLYFEEFPLGHAILLAGVLQVLALAVVLILLPLRWARRDGQARGGRLAAVAYFGALGLGFMFVEVSLMQKLTVFLGHPVYAISLVLSTLLVCAGIGSSLSARLPAAPRTLLVLAVAVPAFLCLLVAVLPLALNAFLGRPEPIRFAVAVALVAPTGLLLGCPFPFGLRLLSAHRPALVPWAFGINGFASVLGGLLSVLFAMEAGLPGTLLAAAGIYAVGLLAGRSWR